MFRRTPQASTIEALYGAIVAQARAPVFYRDYGVADTVNGRLDLLMLHLALVFERLARADEPSRAAGQAAFDRFCRDVDDHLREQGVSDLKVPKDMRRLGEAFFGRYRAYISALKASDREALRGALRRNVFADQDREAIDSLADYVEAAAQALERQPATAVAGGRLDWPDPAGLR
ncbi:ubiquinol-cytochrome C chaperone family protein [Pseudorhodoplanes sp.]|uniref:ubiquinol-cytochrome C chaperone family protein n=1 Tax=Pseudorhodoplanes sp. TaxID=1934341 RepID=UPI003D0AABAB